ncbi:MAG TPA: hypothetical protein VED85_03135, partial [Burkholderiaceae bacterium]|nr:hypothetical protein [Burkholderiaceae bacterium]
MAGGSARATNQRVAIWGRACGLSRAQLPASETADGDGRQGEDGFVMRGVRPLRSHDFSPSAEPGQPRRDLATLRSLLPYLWAYPVRVVLAVVCLVLGKVA